MSGILTLKWEEWMEVARRKGICFSVAKAGGSEAHGPDLKAAL